MLVDGFHQAIGIITIDNPPISPTPTSDSDAMLPGDTTLTMISSLANNDRFLRDAGQHRLSRGVGGAA